MKNKQKKILEQNLNACITFPIAGEEHHYAGMPLFDGDPEHFGAYLDALLDYAGLEGTVLWANEYREDYVLRTGPNAGRKIPGTLFWGEATDSVQGYKTDFPCIMGLGQSWNRELAHRTGEVIGREYINQTDLTADDSSKFSAMICTAMQDMRINPLSGRFDEGFSEDPMLSSEMVDAMAKGVAGTDAPENPGGFWQRSCVVTKHFTTYGGQTFRMAQSNDISMRGLMEHQIKAPVKGVSSGAVGGFMMSFGRTNGVPNTISPAISYMQSLSPYGLYTTPDIFGTSNFWRRDTYKGGAGCFGNGYDKSYIDPKCERFSSALMAHAECGGYVMNKDSVEQSVDELMHIAQAGVCGVDIDEIRRVAKYNLAAYVRNGYLNAKLEDYPFLAQCSQPADETTAEHQQVALQASRESIVLLKNNGILPLSGSEKLAVAGFMAESRFKTVYACRNLPRLEHCGMTPKESISLFADNAGGKVAFHSDGKTVRIKCGGKYLTVADKDPQSENFGAIAFTDSADDAEIFEQHSWGQSRAFSYKSISSGRWLSGNSVRAHFLAPEEPTVMKVNQKLDLVFKDSTLSGILSGMGLPTRLRLEENEDGSFYCVLGGFNESLLQNSPAAYYQLGRLLTVEDGRLNFTEPLGDPRHAQELRTSASRFEFETVSEIGVHTVAENADAAIVVVGAATRHSAGEGVDRSELALGEDQYTLIKTVAAAYPQKTVVIINSCFPVQAQEIQDDPNVAAIVYQPYAGQYDGYAMGEVLFGKYAPTGRLTATWYADMSALPKLDAYSVPEGADAEFDPFEMDPRLSVDLKKQDLISEKLTYQYTDSPVTYPMGHGLSYSAFEYSNLRAGAWKDVTKPLEIGVTVTNTGSVETAEVVQIYVSNPDSAYRSAAPKKTLAAFEKVVLAPGESKALTLHIDPRDVSLWDVNADAYIVEAGKWNIYAGRSCENLLLTRKIKVCGKSVTTLDPRTPFSLFSRTFIANEVTYREFGKKHTLANLKKQKGLDGIGAGYYSVMSKKTGAWAALKNVRLDKISTVALTAASLNSCTAELRLDSPDGRVIAVVNIPVTTPVEYSIPNTGAQPDICDQMAVSELGYTDVTVAIDGKVRGVHDVYVVFGSPDLRIAQMSMK